MSAERVAEAVPTFASGAGWQRRAVQADWSFVFPLVLLAVMAIVYLRLQPSALTTATLTSVLTDALPLILVGAGQTIVIISGGIDISVGGIISLVSVLAATHLAGGTTELLAWSVLLIGLGLVLGAFNGFVIALLNLSPIVVTIATWSIWGGLALFVLDAPGGNIAVPYQNLWTGSSVGIPNAIWAVAVLTLLWLGFRRTRVATYLYAVGSDIDAARVTGVDVRRLQILAYALCGALSAVAALVLVGTQASGDPNIGTSFILDSIAVVVIGGTAVTGGTGGVIRTIVGACIYVMIGYIVFALGISENLVILVKSVVLLVVVALVAAGGALTTYLRDR